jgi:hypothetical protein
MAARVIHLCTLRLTRVTTTRYMGGQLQKQKHCPSRHFGCRRSDRQTHACRDTDMYSLDRLISLVMLSTQQSIRIQVGTHKDVAASTL